MEQYLETYNQYVITSLKLNFFNSCKESKVVPKGLVTQKNLAAYVNDELFVKDFQESLCEASSRSFDRVVQKFEYSKVKLEEKLGELGDGLGLSLAERIEIGRDIHEQNSALKVKLASKHLEQVRRVTEEENAQFELCRGSRRVRGSKYIPPKYCACNIKRSRPCKSNARRRRRKPNQVKFG